jgi:hypothetical protein
VRPVVPTYAIPWLVVTLDDLRRMPLDPRAGFVISLIDGRSSVEAIADMSGMELGALMAILAKLFELGAIELRDPR